MTAVTNDMVHYGTPSRTKGVSEAKVTIVAEGLPFTRHTLSTKYRSHTALLTAQQGPSKDKAETRGKFNSRSQCT